VSVLAGRPHGSNDPLTAFSENFSDNYRQTGVTGETDVAREVTSGPIDRYNYCVAVPRISRSGPQTDSLELPEKAVAPVLLRRKSFTPSARGLLKFGGAAFVGVAVTALFAAPASACDAVVAGVPVCDKATGTVTVTWTVDNPEKWGANVTVKSHLPQASTVDLTTTATVSPHSKLVITQIKVPANDHAKISLHVVWPTNNGFAKDKDADVKFPGTCVKDTPPPATTPPATPPASHGTGGGGGGGAAPSTSGAAAPGLPVTGPNVAVYGGGAVALLATGGGLYMAARRRRIRFEA
jgi:hypothetical protein